MENVKTDGLQKVLTEGRFISAITKTIGEKLRENKKCGSCAYAAACQGGCPALSMISSGGSMLSSDEYKCAFFFGGWYEKFCNVMGDWKNLNPIN